MASDPSEYGPKDESIISLSPDGQHIIYANGPNVIVRSVADPSKAMAYTEHTADVQVAKFSPSGKYVASGDKSGRVRAWAWTHPDHILKNETIALGGPVSDLAWGFESKRIAAVGGGSSKAKVFMFDTGSSLGEVIPLSKTANTVDMKPGRPMRAVWGGEDHELQFYAGPPFKYTCGLKEHTNFVNCVRYSPSGDRFVSVSSDRQGIVYDGKTAEILGRLDAGGMHSGSVYHCAWSPDGARLVTSGGDKTLRIWDMASMGLIKAITVGSTVSDMQNSVTWGPAGIVSLSLNGSLNYFDPDGEDSPTRVIQGHNDPVIAFGFDADSGRMFSVCGGGVVCSWARLSEAGDAFEASVTGGPQHSKRGSGLAIAGGMVATTSWDNTLRVVDIASGDAVSSTGVGGQPRGVAANPAAPAFRVVITNSFIKVFNGEAEASETAAPFVPTCVTVAANGTNVAVGGEDKKVHFFTLAADGALAADGESSECAGNVTCVAFAPDSASLAVGDAQREVWLFNTETKERMNASRWQSHTTRVTGLAWRPSGTHFVTVSTDRRLCIWDPAASSPARKVDLANPLPFTSVAWQDNDHFWTGGTDGVLRRWDAEL